MPFLLRLDKAITHGELLLIRLENGDNYTPSHGEVFLILSGIIDHITLTKSRLEAYKDSQEDTEHMFFQSQILAADISQIYPLFNIDSLNIQGSQYQLVFVTGKDLLTFNGGAGSSCNLQVLIWRVKDE